MDKEQLTKKVYIGDGLYAQYDGYGYWVTSENGIEVLSRNRVYFEPRVLMVFNEYVKEIEKALKK